MNQSRIMDLVLQGAGTQYTLDIAHYYLHLEFVNNIIISCWENDAIETTNSRIIILKNKDVDNPGSKNRNRQIKGSLDGLKMVTTEFSAKLRGDQKIHLDSMYNIYNFYNEHKTRDITYYGDKTSPKNKICVLGIFPTFPFHPSDEIAWGNTQDLIDLYDIPYSDTSISNENYNSVMRAEAEIFVHYYARFDAIIDKYISNKQLYLVDNAPYISEALAISNAMTKQIFSLIPKIEFDWPKYPKFSYSYEHRHQEYGFCWGDYKII